LVETQTSRQAEGCPAEMNPLPVYL